MDTLPIRTQPASEMERLDRIQRENAIIAKAEANIAAGLGLEFGDVERWLSSLDGPVELPFPQPSPYLPVPGKS